MAIVNISSRNILSLSSLRSTKRMFSFFPLAPKSTLSLKLISIWLLIRLSQTPSQFHSPGCLRMRFGLPTGLLGLEGDMYFGKPLCARHACHAPELPAHSRGILSSMSADSKVDCTYAKIVEILIIRFFSAEPFSCAASFGLANSLHNTPPIGLIFLTVKSRLSLLRRLLSPNQVGNPSRRLKLPGKRRSSSFAETVPLASTLVEYVYVVKGTTRGWKISVVKVISGGRSG